MFVLNQGAMNFNVRMCFCSQERLATSYVVLDSLAVSIIMEW